MTPRAALAELVSAGRPFFLRSEGLVVGKGERPLTAPALELLRAAKPRLIDLARQLQRLVFIDFETRSPASLSAVGTRNYIADPGYEVLCLAACLPDGQMIRWQPSDPEPQSLFDAVRQGAGVVAHNAHGFDRLVWERLEWPAPVQWIDSLHLALVAGLPGALEGLGQKLLGMGKDEEGRKLTLAVNRLEGSTGRLPVITTEQRDRIYSYCQRDVHLLRSAYGLELGGFAQRETDVRAVDRAINGRGFQFDGELARAVIHAENELASHSQRLSPMDAASLASPVKLKRWLSAAGIEVKDVRRATLEPLLDDEDVSQDVRAVVVARLTSSGIVGKKLRAGLQRQQPDGRIRDSFAYHQARTGRWSGRGLQPQNLPRGIALTDAQLEALMGAVGNGDLVRLNALAREHRCSETQLLATLVRACIVAKPGHILAVVDYSQIEARMLLWLAGDQPGLESFRRGVDPYVVTAASLFRVRIDEVTKEQRGVGKVADLGCGFQAGADRLRLYGEAMGLNWSMTRLAPDAVVEAWRDQHPAVAGERSGEVWNGHILRRGGLWRDLQAAAIYVVRTGVPRSVGRCHWRLKGRVLVCTLPSGREFRYREPLITLGQFERPQLTYAHGRTRVSAYGGKLAENITQAASRDVLAHALVELERHGYSVVLHVHDEVVCEVPSVEGAVEVKELCEALPAWAAGFPVASDVQAMARYRK